VKVPVLIIRVPPVTVIPERVPVPTTATSEEIMVVPPLNVSAPLPRSKFIACAPPMVRVEVDAWLIEAVVPENVVLTANTILRPGSAPMVMAPEPALRVSVSDEEVSLMETVPV